MSGVERSLKPLVCPHCNSLYEPVKTTEWNFSEWKLTTQFGQIVLKSELQAKIFDLLWRKQGIKGLTRERLIDIIFADDIDGGPSANGIGRTVIRLRKELFSVGIILKSGVGRTNEGYTLLFLTPEMARKHNA